MIQQTVQPEYKPITSAKTSNYFTKQTFTSQVERIKQASEVAQKKVDYDTAHNETILYAIEIVEDFLRKSKRVCYGGQAINAHLPESHKIYDPVYSIPDYDFFTPSPQKDIDYLSTQLKRAGFSDVSVREGMHEGTTKIYVDYVPVADITALHTKIYDTIYKRSAVVNGIHYMDANSLRMLMYLELSRPRGEVTRWGKVFERLMIFNEFIPIKHCTIFYKKTFLTKEHITMVMEFIMQKKRIFAGADLVDFYESLRKHNHVLLHVTTQKPILFYSPNSYQDAVALVSQFQKLPHKKFMIQTITIEKSDMIPFFTIIKHRKQIIACIIEYSACHSYIEAATNHGKIKIASLDTLITLYFSLGLLKTQLFNIGSMECMASKVMEISMKIRSTPRSRIPFVSIECEGHQKTLPSLIREKVQRITRKRQLEKRKTFRKKRT